MLLKNQIISVPLKINVRERIWFSNEPSNVHYPPWQIKSKSKLNKRRKSLGKKINEVRHSSFFLTDFSFVSNLSDDGHFFRFVCCKSLILSLRN